MAALLPSVGNADSYCSTDALSYRHKNQFSYTVLPMHGNIDKQSYWHTALSINCVTNAVYDQSTALPLSDENQSTRTTIATLKVLSFLMATLTAEV